MLEASTEFLWKDMTIMWRKETCDDKCTNHAIDIVDSFKTSDLNYCHQQAPYLKFSTENRKLVF